MVRPLSWFLSPLPLVKLFLIVSLALIALFLMDGRLQWIWYSVIFCFSLIAALFSLFSLLAHFFGITDVSEEKAVKVEVYSAVLCVLAFLAIGGLLIFDLYRMHDGEWTHHTRLPPRNIGKKGWQGRLAIVLGCSIINIILFTLLFLRVRRYGLRDPSNAQIHNLPK